jgi:hypothetical protein
MQELELTAQRLLSVWWLLLWRGSLGGFVVGGIAGILAGFAIVLAGHPELASVSGGYAGLAVAPFGGLLVAHMSLKKKYKDFRIALMPLS